MKTNILRNSPIFRVIAYTVLTAFAGMLPVSPSYAQVAIIMPPPGQMIHITRHFEPPQMVGLKVNLKDPFSFDFIMDQGEKPMSADIRKQEFNKIIKYFLVSLTMPNTEMWVNLSPYESKRIIPEVFAQTEMGRDLLAQDYILKQFTASLIYPEAGLGKKFWDSVYAQAQARFGTTEISVNTFNKVWIVADHADVYQKGDTAFLVGSHLKVMLEQDYMAIEKNKEMFGNTQVVTTDETKDAKTQMASQLVREIIIPAIEKEVNEGKSFAAVRQVYNAEIMATWFKRALKQSLLGQVFANKSKIAGQRVRDPKAEEKIYQQYLRAYKKGVFNYVKEDESPDGQMIPRKYFSGGALGVDPAMINILRTPTQRVKNFARKILNAAVSGNMFNAKALFIAGFIAGTALFANPTIHAQTTQQSGLWTGTSIEFKAFDRQNIIYNPLQVAKKNFSKAEHDKDSVNVDFWQAKINDYGTQLAAKEDSTLKQIQAELAAPGVGVVDDMQWVLPLIQTIQNSSLDENSKRIADGIGNVLGQLINYDRNAYGPGHVEALRNQLKGDAKAFYAAVQQQKIDQQNQIAQQALAIQKQKEDDSLSVVNRIAQEARAIYLTSQQPVLDNNNNPIGAAYNFQITPMYGNFTPEAVHVTLTAIPHLTPLIQQMQLLHQDTSSIGHLARVYEQALVDYANTLKEGVRKDQNAIQSQDNKLRMDRNVYYASAKAYNTAAMNLKNAVNAEEDFLKHFESQMGQRSAQINTAQSRADSAKTLYVEASGKEKRANRNLKQTRQDLKNLATTIIVPNIGIGLNPSSPIGVAGNPQIGPSSDKLQIMNLRMTEARQTMQANKAGTDRKNKQTASENADDVLNALYTEVAGEAMAGQLPGLTPDVKDTINHITASVTRELAQEKSVNKKNHIVANAVLQIMLLLSPSGVESQTTMVASLLRRMKNSQYSWLYFFYHESNKEITNSLIALAENLRSLDDETGLGITHPNGVNPVGAVTPSASATNAPTVAATTTLPATNATTAVTTPTPTTSLREAEHETVLKFLSSTLDGFKDKVSNLNGSRLDEVNGFITKARDNIKLSKKSGDIHDVLARNFTRIAGRALGEEINVDDAMKAIVANKHVGGINLSDKNLVINIKVDGAGMPLPAQFQNKAMMNLKGLTSIIRKITPLAPENIPALYDLVR